MWLAGLAAALLACAGAAIAHDAGFDSKVTIRTDDMIVYKGRVTSDLHRCETNRRVELYTGSDVFLGADRTNDEGRWRINTGPTALTYYARAVRKVIEGNGHRHVCRADRSPEI
jgi:hypothetical protein